MYRRTLWPSLYRVMCLLYEVDMKTSKQRDSNILRSMERRIWLQSFSFWKLDNALAYPSPRKAGPRDPEASKSEEPID